MLGFDPTATSPDSAVMGTPDNTQEMPSIGGHVAHVLSDAGVEIAGSTMPPGLRTENAGTGISVGVGNAVIGGSTFGVQSQQTATPVLIGGQPIVASQGGIVIGGSSYHAGASITIAGTPIAIGAENLVMGGSTYALPSNPIQKPIIIDGSVITRADNGDVVFQGSTIALAVQVTIAGHTMSAGISSVVIDGTSYLLPTTVVAATAQKSNPEMLTLAGGVVISAGGSAAIISGTTYCIPSDDQYLIVNGRTTALPTVSQPIPQIITLANGVTLDAGGIPVTMSGSTYSIPLDGGELVVNGKTMAFPLSSQSVFTIADQTFTAAPNGFTIDGQSVALDGPAITVSGTMISLGPPGLQIGSSTIPLTPAQKTQDSDIGGLIMSGFGSGGAANSSNPLSFTGVGSRLKNEAITTALGLLGINIGASAYVM